MESSEERLVALLAKKDEATFEWVYKTHFKSLHAYAMSILKDEIPAEEVVQNVFFKMWERSENLIISGSIAAYLYKSVYHESLNHIKHLKVRAKSQVHIMQQSNQSPDPASGKLIAKELEGRIHRALQELPEQCRTIFQLSRFDELKYREIADRLKISPKTVENQMGKALKILRTQLIDYLPLIIALFFMFK